MWHEFLKAFVPYLAFCAGVLLVYVPIDMWRTRRERKAHEAWERMYFAAIEREGKDGLR